MGEWGEGKEWKTAKQKLLHGTHAQQTQNSNPCCSWKTVKHTGRFQGRGGGTGTEASAGCCLVLLRGAFFRLSQQLVVEEDDCHRPHADGRVGQIEHRPEECASS